MTMTPALCSRATTVASIGDASSLNKYEMDSERYMSKKGCLIVHAEKELQFTTQKGRSTCSRILPGAYIGLDSNRHTVDWTPLLA